jgi:hypothetical protein
MGVANILRSEDALARLKRVSTAACLASYAAALLMGFGVAWVWSDPDSLAIHARGTIGVTGALPATTMRSYWLALFLGTIPAGLFIYAMLRLAKLFGRFGKGHVLEVGNAVELSRVGWVLVLFGAATPVARALQGVALTFHSPAGGTQLAITLDPGIFGALAAGATLVAFGLVLREAIRLADENDSFV